MDFNKRALALHRKNKGKIEIKSKVSVKTKNDLSTVYTPGVGAVSLAIAKDKKASFLLTNRSNTIAIVTDGSAILGLGNIGPEAGMPVMEGKSIIFKEFAGVDAIPLCINTQDAEEIIKFCKYIEPSFSGINLEDISAPRCFTILERLEKELTIPVFHDDQDGTAIVITAALINACRATNRVLRELNIVINGAGAAGLAIANLLLCHGIKNIILLDSQGIVYQGRAKMNPYKSRIALKTNKNKIRGDLTKALAGADVFIGVSVGKVLKKNVIKLMNQEPIIFAAANPIPEIIPKDAIAAGASIVGTGRSDFPNQINNALAFPGVFRGLLDGHFSNFTLKMKASAAIALAYTIKKPTKSRILPNIKDKNVVKAIAEAIKTCNN